MRKSKIILGTFVLCALVGTCIPIGIWIFDGQGSNQLFISHSCFDPGPEALAIFLSVLCGGIGSVIGLCLSPVVLIVDWWVRRLRQNWHEVPNGR